MLLEVEMTEPSASDISALSNAMRSSAAFVGVRRLNRKLLI